MIKSPKIIEKAWGREEWLTLNDHYCYKRIYINKGYRTSLQYHEKKVETNYLIAGEAEIHLENEQGEMKVFNIKAGDYFDVNPPKKHRVVALTDVILQEVSTIHVDDCIRVQDDFNRPNGKIESEHLTPAFCILAAGKGERLGRITKNLHKGLLKYKDKAIISLIIEKIPTRFDIVIALGYNGNLIQEYCLAAHPERKFTFVNVDKFEGNGSGPGYSILQCKQHLQRPFYFSTIDTLIEGDYPPMDVNWMGVSRTDIPEIYSTVDIKEDDNVISFKNKSKDGYPFAFIGVACIRDYDVFWKQLDSSGEIVSAFYNPSGFPTLKAKCLTWNDVGTIDGYMRFTGEPSKLSLDKNTAEQTYIVKNTFIKINADPEVTKGRIERAKHLNDIPTLTFLGKNTIAYELVPGTTLYGWDSEQIYKDFINKYFQNIKYSEVIDPEMVQKFYINKTRERVIEFLKNSSEDWSNLVINGKKVVFEVEKWLNKLKPELFNVLRLTRQFHGDLQCDNILYDSSSYRYILIDWRNSTGSSNNEYGDFTYDLAKFLGGINFDYLTSKTFKFNFKRDGNEISYLKPSLTYGIEEEFFDMLDSLKINKKDVEFLTGIIYLNMSPIHPGEMGKVLFCEGLKLLYGNQ